MKVKDLENQDFELDQVANEDVEITEDELALGAIESMVFMLESADDLEKMAMESGNETYMALMCGLVAREMNISTESSLEEILKDFNLNPGALGFGYEEELLEDKTSTGKAKIKDRLKNLRVSKAATKLKGKIQEWFIKHFSRRAAISKAVIRLIKVNDALINKLKSIETSEIEIPNIPLDATIGCLYTVVGNTAKTIREIMKLKDGDSAGVLVKHLESNNSFAEGKINTLKEFKSNETQTRKVTDIIKELQHPIMKGSSQERRDLYNIGNDINQAIKHLKSIKLADGENSTDIIKKLNDYEKNSKQLITLALSATKKVYAGINKAIKNANKVKSAANESVEAGMEDFQMLNAMFGEIERISESVGYESDEETADEILTEAMEALEAIERYETALESLEELTVESRIPLQIQALESLASEQGIAFEAIDFTLYGNMSAGNEASGAIIERSNIKPGANEGSASGKKRFISRMWETIKRICKTIASQFDLKMKALKNLPQVFKSMGEYAKKAPAKTKLAILKIQTNIIFGVCKLIAVTQQPTKSEEEIKALALKILSDRAQDPGLVEILNSIKDTHDDLTDSDLKYISKLTAIGSKLIIQCLSETHKLNSKDTTKLYEEILNAYRNEADAKAKASGDIKKYKKLSSEGFSDILKGLKSWAKAKIKPVE